MLAESEYHSVSNVSKCNSYPNVVFLFPENKTIISLAMYEVTFVRQVIGKQYTIYTGNYILLP